MTLPTFVNPYSVVLRTDVYQLTTDYWLDFMIYPGASPAGMAVWVAPYSAPNPYPEGYSSPPNWGYTDWNYLFSLDTVRTFTVTSGGLSVVESQITSRFDLTATGEGVSPFTCSYTLAQWNAQQATFYAENSGDSFSGDIACIPQVYPPALGGWPGGYNPGGFAWGSYTGFSGYKYNPATSTWSIVNQYPVGSGGPGDVNAVFLTGSDIPGTIIPEIAPLTLQSPVVNQGGNVDLLQASYWQDETIVRGYPADSDGDQPFGLVCDRPNISFGTLASKAASDAAFPTLAPLTVQSGATGSVFVSALANTANWGGFRYLRFIARVTGFSTTAPLPRILVGIVPTHLLTQQVCQDALDGDPSLGIWYEAEITEQGTAGQSVTVDLALPIKGSGVWSNYSTNPEAEIISSTPQYPLGTGMFPVNPLTDAPGSGYNTAGGFENWDVDTASLVVAVDCNEVLT